MFFPFQMAAVLPSRTAWKAGILSPAFLRDVQTPHSRKRDCRDGQRLWDYSTTEQFFNVVSALCVAVERRGSTLTMNRLPRRPSAPADSDKQQNCTRLVHGQC